MSDAAVLSAGVGVGLLLLVAGARRVPSARHDGLTVLSAPLVESPRRHGRAPWRAPLVSFGAALDRIPETRARGVTREQDLEATSRTIERHLLVTALSAMGGVATPLLVSGVGLVAGVHEPIVSLLSVCAAGGVIGAVGARFELRHAARRSRDQFRRALCCWLDLVALAQAGGMGVEGALEAATRVSSDPAFSRIRQALDRSRRSGTTPWAELGRLGDRIGVDELDELAVSLGLAGSEGARVRSSLQAKAVSLRRRLMAEAQSRANSTTERLFLPSIVLMVGFLVFVMYPAGVSLSHVL